MSMIVLASMMRAVAHLLQRLVERDLQNLDVLALFGRAAAVRNAVGRRVVGSEEREPLRHAARAHIGRVEVSYIAQPVAELFLGLLANGGFGSWSSSRPAQASISGSGWPVTKAG